MLSLKQRQRLANDSLAYWVNEFITLDNGVKFSFSDHKYLLKPYMDKHPKQAHMKCTQVGITTLAFLRALHGCMALFPLGVIYFFPTDRDVSDFSKSRIKPLIANNQSIRDVMADTDEVGLKKVGRSFIYFRGMRSNIQMKSVPADMIVVDEKDEADPTACAMAEKRLSHSKYQWKLYLSNPTIPGYGIDLDFQESDQNYWQLKCQHCNTWNCLEETFPDCLIKTADGVILACKSCGKGLDKQFGEWVAKYPDRKDIRGYHYTQLFAPFVKPEDIYKEYQQAINRGRLQTFYNLTLGIPYISAKEKLTKEGVLSLCDTQFPSDPFKLDGPTFMGVDQGRDLHIVFKKKHGDKILTWIAFEKDFEQLDKYVKKCSRCVIDALPETRKARELASRNQGKVFMNFYVETQKGEYKWDEEQYIVQENRTESLDASHSLFDLKKNILPARNEEIEEYATHCSNIAKKLEEDEETGSKRYVWVKLGDDHYRHADNYAAIALSSNTSDILVWSLNT
jgi:hypothetical protein